MQTNKRNMKSLFSGAIVGALTTVGLQGATIITESKSFDDVDASLTLDEIVSFDGASATAANQSFDTTGLFLSAVTIRFVNFDLAGETVVSVSEESTFTIDMGYRSDRIELSSPGLNFTLPSSDELVTVANNVTQPAGTTQTYTGSAANLGAAVSGSVPSGSLGSYLNSFDASLFVNGSLLLDQAGGKLTIDSDSLTGAGLLEADYEYSAIPEPGSAIVGALVFFGLVHHRRRR
jgi:hypothetical protein